MIASFRKFVPSCAVSEHQNLQPHHLFLAQKVVEVRLWLEQDLLVSHRQPLAEPLAERLQARRARRMHTKRVLVGRELHLLAATHQ